ncbi:MULTISPECIES: helix-turn-helix domain-containing protein [Bacillales]|jgi:transcriptional regulator with XRE-family HTH domain|uniref:helix-turn-helix domain-containing protein n=1 Tax=Bacillales TaxID=1385 RepID=UPI0006A7837B|nr:MULTISPECIES: helix-turn-helix transcriptional regulator [Bacillales]MBC9204208.1 helix-turn-helix transcriptional regulator [Paenibacillus sp. PL91]OBZ15455.1 transcriptional regulator [Bacillus sp. FJAT-26390]
MENNQLAQRVRAFRKLKGYTQQELAKVLGVSVAVLGSLERGTRKTDPKLLSHIAKTLGISYEELMSDDRQ